MKRCILVIDDNPEILPLTHEAWAEHGYTQRCVKTGEEAVEEITNALKKGRDYRLIALVADYLGERLFPMVKLMRRVTSLPMLILSTEYSAEIKIKAHDLGVDVYQPIPETIIEGISTGLALIRRHELSANSRTDTDSVHLPGDLYVSAEPPRVFFKGHELRLTHREFGLLQYFVVNRNIVLSFEQIYEAVWGDEYDPHVHQAVRSMIKRLRGKLRTVSYTPEYIQSERYRGYRFEI